MRTSCFFVVLAVVYQSSALAVASSDLPAAETLQAMGLGGIEVLSEDEALQIRGSGAFAYGKSWANVYGAGSRDGATAKGKRFAEVHHKSHAEYVKKVSKHRRKVEHHRNGMKRGRDGKMGGKGWGKKGRDRGWGGKKGGGKKAHVKVHAVKVRAGGWAKAKAH